MFRSWKSTCFLLLSFLSLLLVSGCDRSPTEKSWPYPIKDSGFSVRDSGYSQTIYWLDDRRVLFEGHEGGKPRTPEGWKDIQWGLFIWDVEADTVEKYYVPARWLCYHGGYIHYVTEDTTGNPYVREGNLAQEKDYPNTRYYPIERDGIRRNRYSCRLNERPKPMKGRAWIPLLEEHGYLDRGPQRGPRSEEVLFVPADGSQPLELPFDRTQGRLPDYYEFSDSYLFSGHFANADPSGTSPWREGGCDHVWDMTPDGQVSSQCLPYYEQLGTASKFPIKTALGIAMVSHDLDRAGPGKSGIYLYRNDKYERLIAGITRNHAVSPSGCRIAFYHMPTIQHQSIKWPGETTLVMIDLCSEGGNK